MREEGCGRGVRKEGLRRGIRDEGIDRREDWQRRIISEEGLWRR